MTYEKNDEVGVRNTDNNKVIKGKVIDVDHTRVWVKLPTQTVIQFTLHDKTGKYLGKMAGLELELE